MKRQILTAAIGGGLVAAYLLGPGFAMGTHTPANKVIASGSKVKVFAPNKDVELLRGTLRTSSPTDLLMSVSLECSILTRLITGGDNAETSTAMGDIRVWILFDNKIVPINNVGAPAKDRDGVNIGDDTDKVTFCNRTYSRTVTDTEDPADGTDTIDDYIDTKAANDFNWVRLNTGPGIHEIVVKADLTIDTQGDAVAEAVVGNRTLIVEPTKLANDASV